ncbi:hypothetical protein HYU09_03300 [Candidatus Woesearchaeota archaeon]|nr:hypothetical protein [Candidatus Woesearchaeota archaeon]
MRYKRYKPVYVLLFCITLFLSIAIIVEAGKKNPPPPPPPPPPPCGYQTAGCYQDGDIKSDPGSLSAETFSYYLPQNACIGGGCTCGQAGFVSAIKQTDADSSSGACSCISGTSWTESIGCCGDDKADCGLIAEEKRFGEVIDRQICSMSANLRIGSWFSAEANPGDIVHVGCNDEERLSDGKDWLLCDSFQIKNVNGHQYLCNASAGKGSWAECCGSSGCNSNTDGKRLSSGGSVKSGQTTYYCASDSTFTTDLDTKDQASCQGAGLTWTGTLCCSEADDPGEYYVDAAGTKGGCWNKQRVLTGDTAPNIGNVANFNGVFYGCNVNDASILNIKDTHTNQPLVQNKEYCFQDPGKFYFCSINNKWELAGGQDRSHISTVPQSFQGVQQQSECCSAASCWDGAKCVQNQRNSPNAPAVNGFRCVDGNWINASLKFNPLGDTGGFCPEQGQCFVNAAGNPDDNNKPDKNPVCITNEQFIKDNYCESGQWTSRTKFVALQLIDMAKTDDFVVFCDTAENTLNNLNYMVQGQLVGSLVNPENTNNFCTLIFNDKVIIGTSLNKPVADIRPFLQTIGIDSCNAALINDGQYHACDGSSKAWYNQKLNSLVYSKQSFSIGTTNFVDTFISFIKNPFDSMKSRIRNTIQEPFDTSYLNSLNSFSKLYVAKNGNKEIRGSVEGRGFKNLIIEYRNFDTDICRFTDQFNEKNRDAGSGIKCSRDGSTFYVLAQGTQFTKINPDVLWNDLTSKLRIS